MADVPNRRQVFKLGAGVVAGAAIAGRIKLADAQVPFGWPEEKNISDVQAYGVRSPFDKVSRLAQQYGMRPPAAIPGGAPMLWSPIQHQTGIITPSALHFSVFHGHEGGDVHPIDPKEHRLLIHGMVDKPLEFNLEELKRLPTVSRIHFLECNSNSRPALWGSENMPTAQHTHGFSSCTEWTGVPLSIILGMVGVRKGGRWLVAESAHEGKHSKSIPMSKAMHDALIAFGQNGESLRPEQGYPIRLICPGFEGLYQVKFLRRLKVVDEPYMANFESTKYLDRRPDGKGVWFRFEMPPKSVITRPSGGQRLLQKGFHQITGLAWSGGGAITRVEVSTDGGRKWQDAKLQQPVLSKAYTRFTYDWIWNGDETTIVSRCTDSLGQVQPTLKELNAFHRIDNDSFWSGKNNIGGYAHFNAAQPWRIERDGEVRNALFQA